MGPLPGYKITSFPGYKITEWGGGAGGVVSIGCSVRIFSCPPQKNCAWMCPDIFISTWIEAHKYWRPAELFLLTVIGFAEAGRQ